MFSSERSAITDRNDLLKGEEENIVLDRTNAICRKYDQLTSLLQFLRYEGEIIEVCSQQYRVHSLFKCSPLSFFAIVSVLYYCRILQLFVTSIIL